MLAGAELGENMVSHAESNVKRTLFTVGVRFLGAPHANTLRVHRFSIARLVKGSGGAS